MNPCKICVKVYEESPCSVLKHCAFEGTNISPVVVKKIESPFIEQRQLA